MKIAQHPLKSWLPAALVAAGLLWCYLPRLGQSVSWAPYAGDGGDFLAAALTGGVPHPSGYPTYTLLLRAALALPPGLSASTPYARAALFSALCAALAGALLCRWISQRLLPGRPWGPLCAAAAALAWGSAPLVWTHALIVEVHALQSLLVVAFLGWFSLVQELPGQSLPGQELPRPGWGAAALLSLGLGAGLGNHLTLALLAPAAAWALWQAGRAGLRPGAIAGLVGLALLGSGVYLYLPLAARTYPPINWGNPQSWEGFVWTVSGGPYQGLLFQTAPPQIAARISAWARLLFEQFGLPGVALGAAGLAAGRSQRPAVLVYILVVYSVFATGYAADDSLVYLLPAYLAWAGCLAVGLNSLLEWRPASSSHPRQGQEAAPGPLPHALVVFANSARDFAARLGLYRPGPQASPRRSGWAWAAGAAGGLYLLFVLARLPFTAGAMQVYRDPGGQGAAGYVEALLSQAPPGAVVLTSADRDTFPLWYAHFGLGRRPDVRVLVAPLGQFAWYRETIAHTYPDLILPDEPASEPGSGAERLIALNPARPVCRTQVEPPGLAVRSECDP